MIRNKNNSSILHLPITCSTGEKCNTYNEYLRSNHWQHIKYRYYFVSKLQKSCFVCGSFNERNLHHGTYKRVGNENMQDLIVLCKKHHKETHVLFKEDPNVNQCGLWKAYKKIRKNYRKNKIKV